MGCERPALAAIVAATALAGQAAWGQDQARFVEGRNAFALGLLRAAGGDNPSGSLVAPHGVSALLAILREGASGRTAEEIDRALRFDGPPDARAGLFDRTEPSRPAERFGLGADLKSNGGYGVLVGPVAAGSTAERAGLKPGDLVLALDGRPARARPALVDAIARGKGRGRLQVFASETGKVADLDVAFDRETPADAPAPRPARAVWVQAGGPLPGPFREATARYHADLASLDFRGDPAGSARAIDAWLASRAGPGRPGPSGGSEIDKDTRIVLVDHLAFRGRWAAPFPPPTPGTFHAEGLDLPDVPLLRQAGRFPIAEGDDFNLLELPYDGGDFAMLVLLPRGPALDPLLSRLAAADLDRAVGRLKPRRVDVVLPRFRLRRSSRLDPALASLGMPRAFGDSAEFPGIDPDHPLKLGAVRQAVEVEVDEYGTRAEATTAASAVLIKGDEPDSTPFHADRPFLFFLRDRRTGLLFLAGALRKP